MIIQPEPQECAPCLGEHDKSDEILSAEKPTHRRPDSNSKTPRDYPTSAVASHANHSLPHSVLRGLP